MSYDLHWYGVKWCLCGCFTPLSWAGQIPHWVNMLGWNTSLHGHCSFHSYFFCQLYTVDSFFAGSARRLYTAQTTIQTLTQLQHVSSLIYPERLR